MTPTGNIWAIRPRSSPLRLTGAVALLIIAAACSGDDDAAPTTAPPPTTPPTTEPPATTAPPQSTEPTAPPPTATTAPPPATTESITAPTTEPSDEEVKQAVINAAVAAWAAYRDAAREPTDESRLAALAATHSGPTLERSVANITNLVTSGLTAVENPDFPAAIDIYEETLSLSTSDGTATVESCRIGSDLGVELGAGPGGSDVIVVNEVNAYHERIDLVLTNSIWLHNDGIIITKYSDTAECPASS